MNFKITILSHARKRMRERNIKRLDIENAITSPDKLEVDRNYPHRLLAKKIISVHGKPLFAANSIRTEPASNYSSNGHNNLKNS